MHGGEEGVVRIAKRSYWNQDKGSFAEGNSALLPESHSMDVLSPIPVYLTQQTEEGIASLAKKRYQKAGSRWRRSTATNGKRSCLSAQGISPRNADAAPLAEKIT